MKRIAIDGRLRSVASFVRQGAQFADIGTDHAYLPIYLLQGGVIEYAAASDINEGPLESARINAREYGVIDKMSFHLADGLEALAEHGITDIAIAGMGGELIADIIGAASFVKDKSVRLILQPMSRQAHLRRYLEAEGFRIIGESYSKSVGKYYLTICAEYEGTPRNIDALEAELGKKEFLQCPTPEARGYLGAKKKAYEKIARGKAKGGDCPSEELLFLSEIEKISGDLLI
jgi:tRNA (adenine22-N1)-methyltransferase